MLRRFIRDESGIAMGLAVIVVVIVGVMGAGLLVFVRNDLQAVVEVNRGQQAFDAADAGAQAARRHLLSEASKESYDGEDDDDSSWSYDEGGKDLEFAGRDVNVEIRYLKPAPGEAEAEESCDISDEDDDCYTPKVLEADDESKFFQVVSTGESESGAARRRVEAIYHTYDLGVPKAYYSTSTAEDSIRLAGTPDVENVSIFSRGGIEVNGDAEVTGEDYAYGDWINEYNSVGREKEDGTLETRAGIGAAGEITGNGSELETRDYDRDTTPAFAEDPEDGEMTFPFDPDTQEGEEDKRRMEFFRDEAQRQGNLREMSPGNRSIEDWPEDSTDNTVVYVEFNGEGNNELTWSVSGNCDDEGDAKKGTLIVDGADFDLGQNQALFSGVTIIRGGEFAEGEFDSTGKPCWGGFVNADGSITIRGTAASPISKDVVNRPGFYGVELWSWRELYE